MALDIDDEYTAPDEPVAPSLGDDVYVAPSAVVVGDVRLGDEASVWPTAVLRGDIAPIIIGRRSNLQDAVICHVANGKPCMVGNDVTVGHRAILHACTIEDGCLIGMGAIVLDDCRIGAESVVAAGAVVPPRTIVPPGSLVMGLPGKIARPLSESERAQGRQIAAKYAALAKRHAAGFYLPCSPDK